jgi:hypothetical protein
MLFCVAIPRRGSAHHRLRQRRAIVQMRLPFLDRPRPETSLWETLDEEQRALVIELLARLVAKAAVAHPAEEPRHE